MSFPNPDWMTDAHKQWRPVAGKPGVYVHDEALTCEVEIIAYHCESDAHHESVDLLNEAGEKIGEAQRHTGCEQITMHSVHDCDGHSFATPEERAVHATCRCGQALGKASG